MRTDIIFSWFMGGEFDKVSHLFQRPTKHFPMPIPAGQKYGEQLTGADWGWPHPLRKMIAMAGLTPETTGRIALMGFSQGCQGVRMILKSQDAAYVEHAMAFDGIHGNWIGGSPNKRRDNVPPESVGPWIAYADLASRGAVAVGGSPPGKRYCTITHSSIVPPGYPSTTDTAKILLNKLFGSGWPHGSFSEDCSMTVYHDPPINLTPSLTHKTISYSQSATSYWSRQHGLTVVGYNNMDPSGAADHVYQGNVLSVRALRCLLIPRWNDIDPNAPACGVVGVAGPSCNSEAPVMLVAGEPQDASLNWAQYYDGTRQPTPSSSLTRTSAGVALGLAGAAGATYGTWRLYRWLRDRKSGLV